MENMDTSLPFYKLKSEAGTVFRPPPSNEMEILPLSNEDK